ncbi:hypothetical protein DIPPA_29888 [Diplonema papillatum]|nr:hypothetical protein DIPPA_29888 [Diplonema papillatum]
MAPSFDADGIVAFTPEVRAAARERRVERVEAARDLMRLWASARFAQRLVEAAAVKRAERRLAALFVPLWRGHRSRCHAALRPRQPPAGCTPRSAQLFQHPVCAQAPAADLQRVTAALVFCTARVHTPFALIAAGEVTPICYLVHEGSVTRSDGKVLSGGWVGACVSGKDDVAPSLHAYTVNEGAFACWALNCNLLPSLLRTAEGRRAVDSVSAEARQANLRDRGLDPKTLAGIAYFKKMPEASLRELCEAAEPLAVPALGIIHAQGAAADSVAVLVEGTAEAVTRLQLPAARGDEKAACTAHFEAPALLGAADAVLERGVHAASVRATSPVLAWVIPSGKVRAALACAGELQRRAERAALAEVQAAVEAYGPPPLAVVRGSPFFAHWPDGALRAARGLMRPAAYRGGEVVAAKRELLAAVHVVGRGKIVRLLAGQPRDSWVGARHVAGDVFGAWEALVKAPMSGHAKSMGVTEGWVLEPDELKQVLAMHAPFSLSWARRLQRDAVAWAVSVSDKVLSERLEDMRILTFCEMYLSVTSGGVVRPLIQFNDAKSAASPTHAVCPQSEELKQAMRDDLAATATRYDIHLPSLEQTPQSDTLVHNRHPSFSSTVSRRQSSTNSLLFTNPSPPASASRSSRSASIIDEPSCPTPPKRPAESSTTHRRRASRDRKASLADIFRQASDKSDTAASERSPPKRAARPEASVAAARTPSRQPPPQWGGRPKRLSGSLLARAGSGDADGHGGLLGLTGRFDGAPVSPSPPRCADAAALSPVRRSLALARAGALRPSYLSRLHSSDALPRGTVLAP